MMARLMVLLDELRGGAWLCSLGGVDVRPSETGIVDDVFLTESGEGSKLVKVRVRDQRIPQPNNRYQASQ